MIPATCNRATITQVSYTNILGEVSQVIGGTTPQRANTLNVTQQGGSGNRTGAIHQRQFNGMPGQSAMVIQTGTGNRVVRVGQRSKTPGKGARNRSRAEFIGDGNGTHTTRHKAG